MAWFKVDDGFYDHPKIEELPNAAVGLWLKAGTWCAKHETDGLISAARVKALKGSAAQVRALIAARLWVETVTDSGAKAYRFWDWIDYQPTHKQREEERALWREKRRKQRDEKRHKQAKRENVPQSVSESESRSVSEMSGTRPDPTRPDLINPPTPNGVVPPKGDAADTAAQTPALIEVPTAPAKPEPRGTRLPEGWMPTARSVELVRSEHPHLTSEVLEREHRKFRDYWASVAGQRGVKRDWDATWRNWIRKSQEGKTPGQTPSGVPMVGKKIQGYAEAAEIAYRQRMERENHA